MPDSSIDPDLAATLGDTGTAVETATALDIDEAPPGWPEVEPACTRVRGGARGERSNNPYLTRWARYYELLLSVPPLEQIRRSEEQTLERLLDSTLKPTDRVLEIGPGTGRSTLRLASRASHVTAVEQSTEMVSLLERRLASETVCNCSVVLADFNEVSFAHGFDVVAFFGVLDYIREPGPFVERAAGLARRALVFTTPHCGFLAKIFRASSRLRGVNITNQTPDQVRGYLQDFDVDIHETGLRTRLWRGLTLACRAVRR